MNAASYGDPAFAPGEMVTIFGAGFGPPYLQTLRLDENGRVATGLAQTRVLFGGLPARLVYVAKNQLSAVIPYGAEGFLLWGGPGFRTGTIQIRIEYQGRRSAVAGLWLNASAPGIFTADSSGKGQGAILNQDWGRNSPENPAPRGSVVMIYVNRDPRAGGARQGAQGYRRRGRAAMPSQPHEPRNRVDLLLSGKCKIDKVDHQDPAGWAALPIPTATRPGQSCSRWKFHDESILQTRSFLVGAHHGAGSRRRAGVRLGR